MDSLGSISQSTFPKDLSVTDFTYDLPDEKIARYPLKQREESKILVWKAGRIEEGTFADLGDFLPAHSLLVFNNSRVVEARILFQKTSGGQVELFCLEPRVGNISDAMVQTGKAQWTCLIGGASKWKNGQVLTKQTGEISLEARFIEKNADDFTIDFSWTPGDLPFAMLLKQVGTVPVPPYLKRIAENADSERYQTIYAKESGSVAAPTAGLHFTGELIRSLSNTGIQSLYVTLHVGAGTFMPVKTGKLSEHHMHEEYIEVNAQAVEDLISKLNLPVIAVGTTSLRTIESFYWLGLQIYQNENIAANELNIEQKYSYTHSGNIPVSLSLKSLLKWIRRQPGEKLITKTQLFIVPGYSFKIARGLITNFHQPNSTLLMLVAALIGSSWKSVYSWALEHNYRFLSYGDGCLFLP